ncbi:hypothetical protein [Dyadobacter sp. CY347]|uniref:hypothetical protein n=1 Tax=Dyadobacter sp. CY347 TaxID=2909336 RepID=UPI001F1E2FD2|nr:hypothetical protein [Dyadobacter sp. CY347]MCF2488636.1 hypothetical protein [Dyadobacter sp. CY347]
MNVKWRLLGLFMTLSLLGACVLILNHDKQNDVIAIRAHRANPSSIYIKREIKTDLYDPAEGPAPLTGWETSGVGAGERERRMQTRTATRPKQKAPADSSQAGNAVQERDSSAAANRDSAASR